jgi:hypothetical protein
MAMADNDAQDQGGTTDQTPDKNNAGQQQGSDGGQDQRDDTTRQDQIADDVRQDAKDQGKTLTQTEVDKIVADRIARERKKYADYDELKKKAARLQQIEDANKSELDKAKDRETSLQVELQRYKVAEIRRAAASAAGLDSDLADLITAADEEEAAEQARKIAERLKVPAKAPDLRQGARTSPPAPQNRNDLLRTIAGYGPR